MPLLLTAEDSLATGLNFSDAWSATTASRPQVGDAFRALGVISLVALGGTAVVSDRAANLTTC